MKRFLFYCWLTGLASISLAQESVVQQTNPANLKWYQIKTPNFRLLYPTGFDSAAQRVANTLEHIRKPEGKSLGVTPRPITVVLQNQSSISNGFVTLAPRRSEFFAMPSQNYNLVGTNDWLSLISSHEYRHMVQFQKSRTGFSNLVYYAFGQLAQAGMIFAAAPQWFWEGDAVATETAFTQSGRGRIPQFDLLFRTNLLEGKKFNYHKQYLRSYKDNIPDHYVLGYHMVSYLRMKTGRANVWGDVVKHAWDLPFVPFTFSSAIKKETGMNVQQLFEEMAKDLKEKWEAQLEGLDFTSFKIQTIRHDDTYTDYAYPQPLADGSVIAVKSGIGDIAQLVSLSPQGEEEKLFVMGPVNTTGMLSVAGGKIVWNEYRYNPRWVVKSYSVLMEYDTRTRTKKDITRGSRFAAAALSPDGTRVATVETTTSYQTRLVIINESSGNVERVFDNPSNDFIAMPRWSDDGRSIVALRVSNEGKTIVEYNLETGRATSLLPPSQENRGYPVKAGKYVYYNSPYSGIDNIYALDTENKTIYQVTCSKYGAYNPGVSVDGKTLFYNEQTRNGLDVVRIKLDPSAWKPLGTVKVATPIFHPLLAQQEGEPDLLNTIPNQSYQAGRYHRAQGMFNPHSWGPYFNNNLSQASIGVTSEDVLSTTVLNLGYLYDINEKTGGWHAGISYQGFYPIFDFDILRSVRQDKTSAFGRDVQFDWKETGATAGVRIPLLLTRSRYNTNLELGSSIGLTQVSGFRNKVTENGTIVAAGYDRIVQANDTLFFNFTDRVSSGNLLYNKTVVDFSRFYKVSRRDFNPQWAQLLTFEAYNTFAASDFNGNLWAARGSFFFPGLMKHHSSYLRAGYQSSINNLSDLSTYAFRNRISKPRGFSYPRDETFYSIQANYAFPIWYPDIAAGPVLNLQRIKANFFYDYGQGMGKSYLYRFNASGPTTVYYLDNSAIYQSAGVETTFDINIMRFLPQFEVGFRTTYRMANKFASQGFVFEVLIGNIPF